MRDMLKRWAIWMGLPILALAILIDIPSWQGSVETAMFIVIIVVWSVFIARPKLND